MGSCVCTKKSPNFPSVPASPRLPEKLPLDPSEVYRFLITIGKIKVRGLTRNRYALKVEWPPKRFETEWKDGEEIQWTEEWTFRTEASVSELQSQYFSVSLLGTGDKLLSQLFICLWDIATGPSFQNFALLNSKLQTVGRLGIDVKVLQETEIQLSPVTVRCDFLHDDFGRYSLNIRCVGQPGTETPHSVVSQKPNWDFSDDCFRQESNLQMAFQTTIHSIQTASLQFCIWKHRKNAEKTLCAECWIGFNKLLKDERFTALRYQLSKSPSSVREATTPTLDSVVHQTDARIEREFQDKLWYSGKHVGTITVYLMIEKLLLRGKRRIGVMITNFPFISQMIAGVNTEDGVSLQSRSVISAASRVKTCLPAALTDIATHTEKLKEFIVAKPEDEAKNRIALVKAHVLCVEEVIGKLKETQKETMIAHVYQCEGELIEAQHILLDLGELVLEYADMVAYEVRSSYFECLSHLLKRGELDLGHVSLELAYESQIREQKLSVAVRYRSFLRRMLCSALAKLNLKGVDTKMQHFSEVAVAVSYFRIPEFRDGMLTVLKRKSFGEVAEWRGATFDLEEDVKSHSEFLPMFNWEQYFYAFLPAERDPKYERALQEERWQRRIEKRGLAFFQFVAEWATNVKQIFVHKEIPYNEIPGYTVILKSFLLEMKERPVCEYPEAMVSASKALLNNRELISVFILITFQKTNLYSFKTVMDTYRLVNEWLTFLYEKKLGLPTTFNTHVLVKGVKATLSDDIALNVAYSLWLISRNYQIFPPEIKREVVLNCLLGSQAQRIMLHWSDSVRKFFWSFLLFRLRSMNFCPIESVTKVDEEIMTRAEELIASLDEYTDDHTSEKISQETLPYVQLTKKELQLKTLEYEVWLQEKLKESGETQGRHKYGPFKEYPFPDKEVERIFEDEVEKKLEEEW